MLFLHSSLFYPESSSVIVAVQYTESVLGGYFSDFLFIKINSPARHYERINRWRCYPPHDLRMAGQLLHLLGALHE